LAGTRRSFAAALARLTVRPPHRPDGEDHNRQGASDDRISPAVIDRFRADGPGWQGRINEALRKAVGL